MEVAFILSEMGFIPKPLSTSDMNTSVYTDALASTGMLKTYSVSSIVTQQSFGGSI